MLHELFAFLPVVDQHVHNVIENPGQIPLHHILAETSDPTVLADHVPHTLCYLRTLHDLASLFTCGADEVETVRQSIPVEQLAMLSYVNVHALLIDDGYQPRGLVNYPLEWHTQYVPVVKRIYRIEVEVSKFIDDVSNPAYDTIDGVRAAFEAAVRADHGSIVGLKSVACYRTGLSIQPTYDIAAVAAVYATIRADIKAQVDPPPFRLMQKTLIDYLIIVALELALELDIPLQFHTGFGDTDMQLEWGNPTLLKPLLDMPQFQRAKIVLLHSSYPYSREAGYLASVYPHVYVDMGLAVPRLSLEGMKSTVGQLLELCPISKLLFSSDGTITPETTFIGVKWAKFVLAELLQECITANELTVDQALASAKKIFFENAVALYHLPVPVYSIIMPSDAPSVVGVPGGVKVVRLVWCGNDGVLRAKCVQAHRAFTRVQREGLALTSAVQGLMAYADILVPNCGLTSSEDLWVMPDVSTIIQLPHHPKHAMTLVHLKDRDGGTSLCPRSTAHRQVERLKELGLDVYCGFENEFNLYTAQNEPVDSTSYCQTLAINQSATFLDDLVEAIADIGAPLWLVHPEVRFLFSIQGMILTESIYIYIPTCRRAWVSSK
ncbi:hypothetical protein, variant 4 [Aphanomyces astaci]|uniref:GS catalytic domain-containing protein n=1 Tax=Aphanomyces astaci TaxID=112090 RepID=W4G739_APHAT|nr:hypothetical protein, variant 3 [Aphanomyces astaci]XP_009835388.1 hypothetical protein, variant 4 [Aphanomyces astaci]ETV74883.1 hypothetical protein, variant 3 [Aphanomyces astaci]ETV74884.1 hypothetical protein, variant 4 [Aphanomyces astaci]|eukprot:XP_009835387.1 hypothetical protein, variant 3 [Aphanomyces astaci]